MYTPGFDELVGHDGDFFPTYFGRAPLHRPGALTGDPREILSIADLDEMLHFEAIRPPYIRVMKDGVMVPHVAFTEMVRAQGTDITDTVTPQTVYELLRTGATVTWPALNHFRPSVRALTRMLAARFATETNASAFLTPAGARGINPQHAYFEVFVLQLEGNTEWTLWPRPTPTSPSHLTGRSDVRIYQDAELGEPALELTLRPGDVLYLPWGTPNVATGGKGISLHLSLLVRVRLWSDLLRLTLGNLVEDGRFWQAPHLNAATVGRQARGLADRAALLATKLRGLDPPAEVSRLIALGQPSAGSSQGSAFLAIPAEAGRG